MILRGYHSERLTSARFVSQGAASGTADRQIKANARFVMSGAAADVSGPGFGCLFGMFLRHAPTQRTQFGYLSERFVGDGRLRLSGPE